MAALTSLTSILVPKKKANPKGVSVTNTYKPGSENTVLSQPGFVDHMTDIFTSRAQEDSRKLIYDLCKYDPDVSATLHAYLTVARTEPRFYVYNENGELDPSGQEQFELIKRAFAGRLDYTTGFEFTKSVMEIADGLKYMVMARGGVCVEAIFDKFLVLSEFRDVDPATIFWYEALPGVYKPEQHPPGGGDYIDMDIANFFVKYYRQNPLEIYPESMFVSSINTIASRQQVINDLYRIMKITGYPRMEATVVEEVLRKNAPLEMRNDEGKMAQWLSKRLTSIATDISNLRADSVFVHFDSVETGILNEKGPGTSMDVKEVITVLNAQNQAALKTMATIIGRGESGVNTASVEARIFSMSADALNQPIADLFSDVFTFAMRLTGYQGYVCCHFDPAELRPDTELEPQRSIKQSRLLENLSLGLISDDEYHMWLFNRLKPTAAPELSGTMFMQAQPAGVASGKISPNTDALGRSATPSGTTSKTASSNTVKKAPVAPGRKAGYN